jgi:hypothetical protein
MPIYMPPTLNLVDNAPKLASEKQQGSFPVLLADFMVPSTGNMAPLHAMNVGISPAGAWVWIQRAGWFEIVTTINVNECVVRNNARAMNGAFAVANTVIPASTDDPVAVVVSAPPAPAVSPDNEITLIPTTPVKLDQVGTGLTELDRFTIPLTAIHRTVLPAPPAAVSGYGYFYTSLTLQNDSALYPAQVMALGPNGLIRIGRSAISEARELIYGWDVDPYVDQLSNSMTLVGPQLFDYEDARILIYNGSGAAVNLFLTFTVYAKYSNGDLPEGL